MEYSAVCHKMDKNDCYALKKGKFLFRIKTKKNDMKHVVLHFQDKYIPISFLDTRSSRMMTKVASDAYCDYYECELEFDVVCLRYFFRLEDWDGNVEYYSNYEFLQQEPEDNERMFDCPQNLREEEMFVMPEWAAGKVVYQIFPSRYATSKQVPEKLWYKTPIANDDNLQGNLRGVINSLPYLQKLGIDVVYMTPIFESDTCHKYDTKDYYKIDPSFGTKADLKELVDKAHEMGMHVILDAVFNHTSRDFFAFADILEKGADSAYLDWYFIEDLPPKMEPGKKPNYKCFGYHGYMPKLNVRNPKVERYIIDVAKYWIQECGIDGWRMDVGDEISHRFWKHFREELKAVKEDVLIIGEIWHYMGAFLEGDEWDTIMNYHFYNSVMDLLARESITATQFVEKLDFMRGNAHTRVYPVLWNLIDSHDTPRFLHSCGENKRKQKLAAALQLLLPGMPMMYYGDEVALSGGADPDCRRGMLWKEELQDKEMFRWYQKLIEIRHTCGDMLSTPVIENHTEDASGVIVMRRGFAGKYTLIFQTKDQPVELPEYVGKKNLLTGETFGGVIENYGVAVLM